MSSSAPNIQKLFDLALQHHQAGRLREAEQLYRQILVQQPEQADVLHLLGLIAHQVGRHDRAAALIRRSIAINPHSAEAHYNLATTLKDTGKHDEVIAAFRQAIVLRPNFPAAQCNLGNALRDHGQLNEAVAAYHEAISRDPTYAEAHCNLGIALQDLGRPDEAMHEYRASIALNPNYPDPHWNLSLMLLTAGQFAQGWEEFEWRLRVPALKLNRDFPQPYWDGSNQPGQTLLIYTEGGFGDAIHFIRLVPLISERVGKIILECQPELLRLFENFPGIDHCVARGHPLPRFDSRIPLQSLPRILSLRLENIPATVPYLNPPRQSVESWEARLPRDGRKKIGLRWAGSPSPRSKRSTAIDLFAPLARIPNLRFFSLQKGPESNQSAPPGMDLNDYTNDLTDFAESAALIQNLDLVISVDTSIAHLAGSLAKPIWVLIPSRPDFRWLLDRQDTRWYPTMRLFRQNPGENWDSVIPRLAAALQDWVKIPQ
ncbi:MAG: tetratricopeptide repeat-containing glycosyltransferase family protein [Tepidisphaeraceae bacterium]|jgi:Flp pilus assembly protein TadD